MVNIPLEQRNYEVDHPNQANSSPLERSIQRNSLIRDQLQNLLGDLEYGYNEAFVKKELNRILLDT